MPLSYRVATTNNGNTTLGKAACARIKELMASSDTELMILQCQETHLKKTLEELEQTFKDTDYGITNSHLMVTHTKPKVYWSKSTGLVTIAIHKKTLNVRFSPAAIESRRANQKSAFDNGFNKGGLITEIHIEKQGAEFRLDSINAHLESYRAATRILDWKKLFQAYHRTQVNNFKALSERLPHGLCLGMDANTRDFVEKSSPWDGQGRLECASLTAANLSNQLYSNGASTYKTDKPSIHSKLNPKRPGRIEYGQLDIAGTLNTSAPLTEQSQLLNDDNVTDIDLTAQDSERDHHVIITPKQELNLSDDFTRVERFLAHSLNPLAPELSTILDSMTRSPENEQRLHHFYHRFFSSNDAILKRLLDLEQEKVAWLEQIAPQKSHLQYTPGILRCDAFNALLAEISTTEESIALFDTALTLEKLAWPFKTQASDAKERETIDALVKQAMAEYPIHLYFEPLLKINRELNHYRNHLEQSLGDKQAQKKINRVDTLLATLSQEDSPLKTRVEQLQHATTDMQNDPLFNTHRDSQFWHRLFRYLKKQFNPESGKTRGEKTLHRIQAFFPQHKQETESQQHSSSLDATNYSLY